MSLLQLYIAEHFSEATSLAAPGSSDSQLDGANNEKRVTSCPWVLRDTTGAVVRRGKGDLSDMPKADIVQVVVPASMVLLAQVRVPSRNRRKMLQLLPYAVEEKLMYDPESIHVAAGPDLSGGETVVAVIDKEWVRRVIKALQNAGLSPRQMWPETLLPDVRAGSWTMVWNGREGFLRTGNASGSSLDGGSKETPPLGLLLAVKEAAAKRSAPQKIDLRLTEGSDRPDIESWAAQLAVPVTVNGIWDWSSAAYGIEKGVNLLQGEFASAGMESDWLPRLRFPLLLVALIVLLQAGGSFVDWLILGHEKRQVDGDMQSTFRQTFPEAKAIVDPPLQMQRNLAKLRHAQGVSDPSDFLPFLANVAPVLFQSGLVATQSIRYDDGIMKLETKLHRPEVVHSKPSAQQVKKGTEQLQPKDRSVVQDTAEGAGTGPSADWKDQLRKRFQVVGVNADIEKVDIKQSGETTIYLTLRRAGL